MGTCAAPRFGGRGAVLIQSLLEKRGTVMKKTCSKSLILALVLAGIFAFSSIASAADSVIPVPWEGNPANYHTAISGQNVTLAAVVKTGAAGTRWYRWVYGDTNQSVVSQLSGATYYNVADSSHAYSGAVGTTFTATLEVDATDGNFAAGQFVSGNYFVKIQTNNLNAMVNIAIDNGLWWLHCNNSSDPYLQSYNGLPVKAWEQGSYVNTWVAPTAAAIHAFGINNHKLHGDPTIDPYVDDVVQGMNFLINGYRYNSSYPSLLAQNLCSIAGSDSNCNQNGTNPYQTHYVNGVNTSAGTVNDYFQAGQASPNGLGIEVYGWEGGSHTPYEGGQVIDAIVASGANPTDLTGRDFLRTDGTTGNAGNNPTEPGSPGNWTFQQLVQNLVDDYTAGQWDYGDGNNPSLCDGSICGSWWYNWNYSSPGDNSASQWGAIGLIPAQQSPWNAIVPQWVKTYNANWLDYSKSIGKYCYDGVHNFFSYNGYCGCAGDSCEQTTGAGLVQMVLDGQNTTDTKWVQSQLYLADNWWDFLQNGSSWGPSKSYGWFSFAKAMRLAMPGAVTTIVKSNGHTFDWYNGGTDVVNNDANFDKGIAPRIVELQQPDGHWNTNLADPPLGTAWMIITLNPTLFQAGPYACFTVNPNPGLSNFNINFDPSCSGDNQAGKSIANLKKFDFNWGDGSSDSVENLPGVVTHQFACSSFPCYYSVTLTVYDDSTPQLQANTVQTVTISEPPVPPVANAGGPYMVSMCTNDSLKLNGSGSYSPDAGQSLPNDPPCALTSWNWALLQANVSGNNFVDASGQTVSLPQGSASGQIGYYFSAGSNQIGLEVTDNSSQAFPPSPNLTGTNFTTVNLYNACGMCNLATAAKPGKVQLTWHTTGAASYSIYRSSTGSNSGFALIKSGVVNTSYVDTSIVKGVTYYYRVVDSNGCGSNPASSKAL